MTENKMATDTKTVMLVDDDPDFLFQEKVQLEAAGFATVTASSVEEAEGVLAEHKPDIAVVDVMMQNTDDGFVLCHKIKKVDASIPVILVTSVTSETGIDFDAATDEERSWVKADAFLAKPVRIEQLQKEIDRLLSA